jgi:hypothetical protein
MPDDAKQQKEKAAEIVARAKSDPSFKQQVQDDPLGVLRQAGLSDEAIGDFLREDGYADLDPNDAKLKPKQKAAADMAAARDCLFTCIFTECPITRI